MACLLTLLAISLCPPGPSVGRRRTAEAATTRLRAHDAAGKSADYRDGRDDEIRGLASRFCRARPQIGDDDAGRTACAGRKRSESGGHSEAEQTPPPGVFDRRTGVTNGLDGSAGTPAKRQDRGITGECRLR